MRRGNAHHVAPNDVVNRWCQVRHFDERLTVVVITPGTERIGELTHERHRDGREDLLTVRTANDVLASVGYSRQMPDGSYDTEVRFPLTATMYTTNPRGIAAGDFTGDGCSDIAAVSGASLVLLQAACVPLRVMSGPLPPRLVQSPTVASSSPVSAQTIAPIDDMARVRPARRSAKPIDEPRRSVRRAVR